jgi:mono/diheme cytochrome c family protein
MIRRLNGKWHRPAALISAVIFGVTLLIASVPARTASDDDFAALYKSKCFACHGATAEKKFDATKADADLIQTVLKGKKMEKPPNMPAYEEKGITADQAKGLIQFMKSQRQ